MAGGESGKLRSGRIINKLGDYCEVKHLHKVNYKIYKLLYEDAQIRNTLGDWRFI